MPLQGSKGSVTLRVVEKLLTKNTDNVDIHPNWEFYMQK